MQYMSSEELLKFLKDNLKDSLIDGHIETKKAGIKQEEYCNIWLEIERNLLSLAPPATVPITGTPFISRSKFEDIFMPSLSRLD